MESVLRDRQRRRQDARDEASGRYLVIGKDCWYRMRVQDGAAQGIAINSGHCRFWYYCQHRRRRDSDGNWREQRHESRGRPTHTLLGQRQLHWPHSNQWSMSLSVSVDLLYNALVASQSPQLDGDVGMWNDQKATRALGVSAMGRRQMITSRETRQDEEDEEVEGLWDDGGRKRGKRRTL